MKSSAQNDQISLQMKLQIPSPRNTLEFLRILWFYVELSSKINLEYPKRHLIMNYRKRSTRGTLFSSNFNQMTCRDTPLGCGKETRSRNARHTEPHMHYSKCGVSNLRWFFFFLIWVSLGKRYWSGLVSWKLRVRWSFRGCINWYFWGRWKWWRFLPTTKKEKHKWCKQERGNECKRRRPLPASWMLNWRTKSWGK